MKARIDSNIIVTEGPLDAEIIEKLLSDTEIKFKVYSADGFSSALSTTRSLMINGEGPIYLILDTDSLNVDEIEDKKRFLNMYFGRSNDSNKLTVIWAKPEFEIIFTDNKETLEQLVKQKITNEMFEIANNSPKKAIEVLSKGKGRTLIKSYLQNKMHREILRKSYLIQSLIYHLQRKEQIFTFTNTDSVKTFSIRDKESFMTLRRIAVPSLIATSFSPNEWSKKLLSWNLRVLISCSGNGAKYKHGDIILDSLISPYHRNPIFDLEEVLPPRNKVKYDELKIEIKGKADVPYVINLVCDITTGFAEKKSS